LKIREEQQKLERSGSQKEVAPLKRRGSEMTGENKLHEESRRGSTIYNDLQTTVGTFVGPNNVSQTHTSRSTMREEREAEIHMLTQRVIDYERILKITDSHR